MGPQSAWMSSALPLSQRLTAELLNRRSDEIAATLPTALDFLPVPDAVAEECRKIDEAIALRQDVIALAWEHLNKKVDDRERHLEARVRCLKLTVLAGWLHDMEGPEGEIIISWNESWAAQRMTKIGSHFPGQQKIVPRSEGLMGFYKFFVLKHLYEWSVDKMKPRQFVMGPSDDVFILKTEEEAYIASWWELNFSATEATAELIMHQKSLGKHQFQAHLDADDVMLAKNAREEVDGAFDLLKQLWLSDDDTFSDPPWRQNQPTLPVWPGHR